MIKRVFLCYFSPTGGTKKASKKFVEAFLKKLKEGNSSFVENVAFSEIDFTRKENRSDLYSFSDEDFLIIASPVYAGRLPNKILPDFKRCIKGDNSACIALCCYGNRSYGGALTELRLMMQENGFNVVSAAAIVSQHPFSNLVGNDRLSEADIEEIARYAQDVYKATNRGKNVNLPLDTEIPPYYIPLKIDNSPAKFLKAKPKTDETLCDNCGICAEACPMGSIDTLDCSRIQGVCIKCQACIKVCPHGAKSFKDGDFLSHVKMLEKNYTKPNNNVFILPK